MKIEKILNAAASSKHVEDWSKDINRLVEKRFTDFKSINLKMWRRDFKKYLSEMELEIAFLKKFIEEDETESATEM